MSEAMIIRRGGGGGSVGGYAVIGVEYPAGSSVTCLKGDKSLKAKSGDGRAFFGVPEAGTWTVTCTDGTDTASEAVTITAEGQVEKISLSYKPQGTALIENGVVNSDYTWTTGTGTTAQLFSDSDGNGYLHLEFTDRSYTGTYGCAVDLTDYSTLTMDGYNVGNASPTTLELTAWDGNAQRQLVSFKGKTTRTTVELDVSALTGTWKVGIWGRTDYTDADGARYARAQVYNLSLR